MTQTTTQTTAREYVNISRDGMETVLDQAPLQFEEVDYDWAQERIYEAHLRSIFIVRVYSSIDKRSDSNRSCGSDAIRIVVLRTRDDADPVPISKKPRTNRIQTWAKNLLAKLEEVYTGLPSHITQCTECGGIMVIRTNSETDEDFHGCINYPECRNTTSI